MSSETTNWEAIARYLAGEGSAEEQASVREWLAAHPAESKTVAALDGVLNGLTMSASAPNIDVEAALARVKARRDRPELTVARGGVKRAPFERRRFNWIPLVAAATIVLAVGLWAASRKSTTSVPITTIASRTLLTPVGGRDSLVLPDGSQVVLGPGSSLIMAQGYGQGERRVSIRGQALFTVVHDASKPFIVDANGAEIRDVGTSFVVHSDAGDTRVTVTDGVVDLVVHGMTVTLRARDAASISGGIINAQRGVGVGDDLAWTTGRLVFRDAPLVDVAEDLKRWYGVELDIRDPALGRRPLSAEFAGDSLSSVLRVISSALGATMERRGDTVVVRNGR
jgi:transmembrane sensor